MAPKIPGFICSRPDGLAEMQHFTMDNSPLLSNTITSISINNENGEVFFGTANGIISYKSTATQGGKTYEDVYAYPNPVRPGYSGSIAIKGLVTTPILKLQTLTDLWFIQEQLMEARQYGMERAKVVA